MKKIFLYSFFSITVLTIANSCQNTTQPTAQAATAQATSPQPTQAATPISADLSTADFQKKLSEDKNALILDVRTPQEFAEGHLKNARMVNFQDADFKEKISKLDKSLPVYVYCAVGGRSANAAKILQESGFQTVYNLLGGFNGWKASGLPSE